MSSPSGSISIPEQPLSEALKREKAQREAENDCMPCRIMGATAFGGLGAYSYISGQSELTKRQAEILKSGSRIGLPARRLGVTVTSAILVGLGAYRLFA